MNLPPEAPAPLPARTWLRFAGRVLLCGVAVFALVWGWTARLDPFAYFPVDYPILAGKASLAALPWEWSTAILGDSRPLCGLEPARIGPGIVNLACPGGTPIEMYFTARRGLIEGGAPHTAIISFSSAQLVHDPAFWETTVRSGYLSPAEVDAICAQARRTGDREILGHYPWWVPTNRFKQFALPRRFPTFFWSTVLGSHFGRRGPANHAILEEVIERRGQLAARANPDKEERDALLAGFVPGATNAWYFERTLEELAGRGVPAYFVAPPRRADLLPTYAPAMRAGCEEYLTALTVKYPGFHLLGPLWPTLPPDCFADAAHLNAEGAARWSESVRQLLPP